MLNPFVLETVNDMVERISELPLNEQPSFFVVGAPKMNKSSKLSIQNIASGKFEIPVIILKQSPIVDTSRIFVVAIKTTDLFPIDVALELMKTTGDADQLVVLFVVTGVKIYHILINILFNLVVAV